MADSVAMDRNCLGGGEVQPLQLASQLLASEARPYVLNLTEAGVWVYYCEKKYVGKRVGKSYLRATFLYLGYGKGDVKQCWLTEDYKVGGVKLILVGRGSRGRGGFMSLNTPYDTLLELAMDYRGRHPSRRFKLRGFSTNVLSIASSRVVPNDDGGKRLTSQKEASVQVPLPQSMTRTLIHDTSKGGQSDLTKAVVTNDEYYGEATSVNLKDEVSWLPSLSDVDTAGWKEARALGGDSKMVCALLKTACQPLRDEDRVQEGNCLAALEAQNCALVLLRKILEHPEDSGEGMDTMDNEGRKKDKAVEVMLDLWYDAFWLAELDSGWDTETGLVPSSLPVLEGLLKIPIVRARFLERGLCQIVRERLMLGITAQWHTFFACSNSSSEGEEGREARGQKEIEDPSKGVIEASNEGSGAMTKTFWLDSCCSDECPAGKISRKSSPLGDQINNFHLITKNGSMWKAAETSGSVVGLFPWWLLEPPGEEVGGEILKGNIGSIREWERRSSGQEEEDRGLKGAENKGLPSSKDLVTAGLCPRQRYLDGRDIDMSNEKAHAPLGTNPRAGERPHTTPPLLRLEALECNPGQEGFLSPQTGEVITTSTPSTIVPAHQCTYRSARGPTSRLSARLSVQQPVHTERTSLQDSVSTSVGCCPTGRSLCPVPDLGSPFSEDYALQFCNLEERPSDTLPELVLPSLEGVPSSSTALAIISPKPLMTSTNTYHSEGVESLAQAATSVAMVVVGEGGDATQRSVPLLHLGKISPHKNTEPGLGTETLSVETGSPRQLELGCGGVVPTTSSSFHQINSRVSQHMTSITSAPYTESDLQSVGGEDKEVHSSQLKGVTTQQQLPQQPSTPAQLGALARDVGKSYLLKDLWEVAGSTCHTIHSVKKCESNMAHPAGDGEPLSMSTTMVAGGPTPDNAGYKVAKSVAAIERECGNRHIRGDGEMLKPSKQGKLDLFAALDQAMDFSIGMMHTVSVGAQVHLQTKSEGRLATAKLLLSLVLMASKGVKSGSEMEKELNITLGVVLRVLCTPSTVVPDLKVKARLDGSNLKGLAVAEVIGGHEGRILNCFPLSSTLTSVVETLGTDLLLQCISTVWMDCNKRISSVHTLQHRRSGHGANEKYRLGLVHAACQVSLEQAMLVRLLRCCAISSLPDFSGNCRQSKRNVQHRCHSPGLITGILDFCGTSLQSLSLPGSSRSSNTLTSSRGGGVKGCDNQISHDKGSGSDIRGKGSSEEETIDPADVFSGAGALLLSMPAIFETIVMLRLVLSSPISWGEDTTWAAASLAEAATPASGVIPPLVGLLDWLLGDVITGKGDLCERRPCQSASHPLDPFDLLIQLCGKSAMAASGLGTLHNLLFESLRCLQEAVDRCRVLLDSTRKNERDYLSRLGRSSKPCNGSCLPGSSSSKHTPPASWSTASEKVKMATASKILQENQGVGKLECEADKDCQHFHGRTSVPGVPPPQTSQGPNSSSDARCGQSALEGVCLVLRALQPLFLPGGCVVGVIMLEKRMHRSSTGTGHIDGDSNDEGDDQGSKGNGCCKKNGRNSFGLLQMPGLFSQLLQGILHLSCSFFSLWGECNLGCGDFHPDIHVNLHYKAFLRLYNACTTHRSGMSNSSRTQNEAVGKGPSEENTSAWSGDADNTKVCQLHLRSLLGLTFIKHLSVTKMLRKLHVAKFLSLEIGTEMSLQDPVLAFARNRHGRSGIGANNDISVSAGTYGKSDGNGSASGVKRIHPPSLECESNADGDGNNYCDYDNGNFHPQSKVTQLILASQDSNLDNEGAEKGVSAGHGCTPDPLLSCASQKEREGSSLEGGIADGRSGLKDLTSFLQRPLNSREILDQMRCPEADACQNGNVRVSLERGDSKLRLCNGTVKGSRGATEGEKEVQEKPLNAGDKIHGLVAVQNGKRRWFPGVIADINSDGTLLIKYNDGDVEPTKSRHNVRIRRTRDLDVKKHLTPQDRGKEHSKSFSSISAEPVMGFNLEGVGSNAGEKTAVTVDLPQGAHHRTTINGSGEGACMHQTSQVIPTASYEFMSGRGAGEQSTLATIENPISGQDPCTTGPSNGVGANLICKDSRYINHTDDRLQQRPPSVDEKEETQEGNDDDDDFFSIPAAVVSKVIIQKPPRALSILSKMKPQSSNFNQSQGHRKYEESSPTPIPSSAFPGGITHISDPLYKFREIGVATTVSSLATVTSPSPFTKLENGWMDYHSNESILLAGQPGDNLRGAHQMPKGGERELRREGCGNCSGEGGHKGGKEHDLELRENKALTNSIPTEMRGNMDFDMQMYYTRQRSIIPLYQDLVLHQTALLLLVALLAGDLDAGRDLDKLAGSTMQQLEPQARGGVDNNTIFALQCHVNQPENAYVLPGFCVGWVGLGEEAAALGKLVCTAVFDPGSYFSQGTKHIAWGRFGQVLVARSPLPCREGKTADVALATIDASISCRSSQEELEKLQQSKQVAIKVIDRESSIFGTSAFANIFSEVMSLRLLADVPEICKLLDFGLTEASYVLVLEHCSCSLKEWRLSNRAEGVDEGTPDPPGGLLDVSIYLKVFRQVVSAVAAMTSKGVIHLDLKCDNILVRNLVHEEGLVGMEKVWVPSICVADFGEAVLGKQELQHRPGNKAEEIAIDGFRLSRPHGTECIQSPEMLVWASLSSDTLDGPCAEEGDLGDHLEIKGGEKRQKPSNREGDLLNRGSKITPASDVWSLGCLLYELLTGHFLFETSQWSEFFVTLTASNSGRSNSCRIGDNTHLPPPLPPPERMRVLSGLECAGLLENLLSFILVRMPEKRPQAKHLLERVDSDLINLLNHKIPLKICTGEEEGILGKYSRDGESLSQSFDTWERCNNDPNVLLYSSGIEPASHPFHKRIRDEGKIRGIEIIGSAPNLKHPAVDKDGHGWHKGIDLEEEWNWPSVEPCQAVEIFQQAPFFIGTGRDCGTMGARCCDGFIWQLSGEVLLLPLLASGVQRRITRGDSSITRMGANIQLGYKQEVDPNIGVSTIYNSTAGMAAADPHVVWMSATSQWGPGKAGNPTSLLDLLPMMGITHVVVCNRIDPLSSGSVSDTHKETSQVGDTQWSDAWDMVEEGGRRVFFADMICPEGSQGWGITKGASKEENSAAVGCSESCLRTYHHLNDLVQRVAVFANCGLGSREEFGSCCRRLLFVGAGTRGSECAGALAMAWAALATRQGCSDVFMSFRKECPGFWVDQELLGVVNRVIEDNVKEWG